jgi:hypothetical protein
MNWYFAAESVDGNRLSQHAQITSALKLTFLDVLGPIEQDPNLRQRDDCVVQQTTLSQPPKIISLREPQILTGHHESIVPKLVLVDLEVRDMLESSLFRPYGSTKQRIVSPKLSTTREPRMIEEDVGLLGNSFMIHSAHSSNHFTHSFFSSTFSLPCSSTTRSSETIHARL